MVFNWLRTRKTGTATLPAAEEGSIPLLHDRVRSSLGTPGPHLCRPLPAGCSFALDGIAPLARWHWLAPPARESLCLVPIAGSDEAFLVLERERPAEVDRFITGLMTPAIVRDPWRLEIVLARLFDANLRLDPPLLPSLPHGVVTTDLLPPRHLRTLFWTALQQLETRGAERLCERLERGERIDGADEAGNGVAARPTEPQFERWWKAALAAAQVTAPDLAARAT